MQFLYDAIACGSIAALTWMGLVWMSSEHPIVTGKGWVQGVILVAISNAFIWVVLAGLNVRLIALWAISFVIVNAGIANFVFPLFEDIKISRVWALVIHPVAIATMSVLLGGAIGIL